MMKCYDWDTVAAKLGYKNQHECLYDLYWTQDKKIWQIAKLASKYIEGVYCISEKTVRNQLIRNGIQRKPRGGMQRHTKWPGYWYEIQKHDYQNMTMREICNATRLNSSQFYNVQRSNPFIYKRVRMK